MKAVIVAAGRSSRLYPLTHATPKCLLPVGGSALLERAANMLGAAGVDELVVVVGFCHEQIRERLAGRASFVLNASYAETNNMASLGMALPQVADDDFVYMHADVIVHEGLLERLLAAPADHDIQLLTDFDHVDDEAMKVRAERGRFAESSKLIPLDQAAGEWVGLARVARRAAAPLLAAIEGLLAEGQRQAYDTAAFTRLARAGMPIGLTPTDGLPWCEIDTPADLARARALFNEPARLAEHAL